VLNLFISLGLSSVAASLGELGKAVGALERVAELVVPANAATASTSSNGVAATAAATAVAAAPAAAAGASSSSNHDASAAGVVAAAAAGDASSSGRVEFRDVWFRYPGAQDWAIRGLSLTLLPGQTVALVGPSGGGKSTIAALLLGLYHPQRGSILVNGEALQPQAGGGSAASAVGMAAVMQQPMLMSGSVKDQIRWAAGLLLGSQGSQRCQLYVRLRLLHAGCCMPPASPPQPTPCTIASLTAICAPAHCPHCACSYGKPGATSKQVLAAAKAAHADEFVRQLPSGYETEVGERGHALSGGQKQRLAIARALLLQPKVRKAQGACGGFMFRERMRVYARVCAPVVLAAACMPCTLPTWSAAAMCNAVALTADAPCLPPCAPTLLAAPVCDTPTLQILVLDEVTSALDVASERYISDTLRRLTATKLIIAHRCEIVWVVLLACHWPVQWQCQRLSAWQ
jgi:energy-coupling factor transporter ATP-binding protein EcfA2